MALPFNPFDKKAPEKKFTKVKVFERAPFETEQNKTEQNSTEPDKTEQFETNIDLQTKQNSTEPNTILNKKPNRSEQNKTEQNKTDEMILSLTGVRKKLVSSIFDLLLQKNATEIETNYNNWADLAHVNKNSIKTTVRSLKLSGYFEIEAPKGGRGALIIVRVSKDMLISYSKYQTQLNKQLNTTLNKSSSYSSNKVVSAVQKPTTTIVVPENLSAIISQNEVSRLLGKGFNEEDISESLRHFSFDLENNLVRSKTGSANLLFGILRSGQRYKSIKLIEDEINDLKAYQQALDKAEAEKKVLRDVQLKKQFDIFKASNADFIEKIRIETSFATTDEVLERIAFEKFKELNNET